MTLKEKLNKIQVELKAPKNLYNKYGNYKYRNAEGILEGVKPLLAETKTILLLQDEIVTFGNPNNTYRKYEEDKGAKSQIEATGERFYVKATVTLKDCESDDEISISAYARESFDKKGQDQSQITGSTSSYARKYALNGLFILDDTKDEDTNELKEEKDNKTVQQDKAGTNKPLLLTKEQYEKISELIQDLKLSADKTVEDIKHFKKERLNDLTKKEADQYIQILEKRKKDGENNGQQ